MDQHLACPYCNQTMAVSLDLAGQMAQCPYCSGEFVVPAAPAPQAPVRSPAARPNRGVQGMGNRGLGGGAGGLRKPGAAPRRSAPSGGKPWLIGGAVAVGSALVPIGIFGIYLMLKPANPAPAAANVAQVAQAETAPEPAPAQPQASPVLTGEIVAPASSAPAAPMVSAPTQPPVASTTSAGAASVPPPVAASPYSAPAPNTAPAAPGVPATGLPAAAAPPAATALPSETPPSETNVPRAGGTKQVVQMVEPSVVVIEVPGVGLGSGFLIDEQGTIVTNYHVIEGAKTATATFLTDKSKFDVRGFLVVAPGKDVAILKIEPAGRRMQPLPLAASPPEKADSVLAFGAPRGLGGSVTDGIISAIRTGSDIRELLMGNSKRDIYTEVLGYDQDAVWLQTSTPISGGNSGGPLVNLKGEVVGMNTWSRTDGQNLNFAISAENIRKVMLSAQSGLRPLSDLPKPRKDVGPVAMGDGARTLAYWKQIGEINRDMFDKLKKFPRPALPTSINKRRNFHVKLSNFYRRWAEVLP